MMWKGFGVAGIMIMAAVLLTGGASVSPGADDAAQPSGTFEKAQTALGSSDSRQASQIAEKARMTFENFRSATQMDPFRNLLKDAKAIFIAPGLMKFAFFFGGSGGNGVLLVRDDKTGEWLGPAFYTIGGASFGLQIGGQSSEVVLLAMTDRGVTSLLSSSFKLGADASIAAGPVGMGLSAATANVSADILTFSRAKGLFAGISLDGSVVKVRNGMNEAYYNTKVTPVDILIKRTVSNPDSKRLIAEVTEAATRKAEKTEGKETASSEP